MIDFVPLAEIKARSARAGWALQHFPSSGALRNADTVAQDPGNAEGGGAKLSPAMKPNCRNCRAKRIRPLPGLGHNRSPRASCPTVRRPGQYYAGRLQAASYVDSTARSSGRSTRSREAGEREGRQRLFAARHARGEAKPILHRRMRRSRIQPSRTRDHRLAREPTVDIDVRLSEGSLGRAAVPSGA